MPYLENTCGCGTVRASLPPFPCGHAKQHASVEMPVDRPKTPFPSANSFSEGGEGEEDDEEAEEMQEDQWVRCLTEHPRDDGATITKRRDSPVRVCNHAQVAALLRCMRVGAGAGAIKRPVAAPPSVRKHASSSGVTKSARFGLPRQMTRTIDASKAAALVRPIPLRPLPLPRPRPGAGVLQTIPEHDPD